MGPAGGKADITAPKTDIAIPPPTIRTVASQLDTFPRRDQVTHTALQPASVQRQISGRTPGGGVAGTVTVGKFESMPITSFSPRAMQGRGLRGQGHWETR